MKPQHKLTIKVTLLILSLLSSGSAGCARIAESATVEPTQVESKVDPLDAAITKAAQGYNQPTQVEQVAVRQAPVEESPLIQVPSTPSYGVVRAIKRANVRSGTGLNYPILYVLEVGETAELADREPRFVNGITWYAVRGEFGNGWVASSLVRL